MQNRIFRSNTTGRRNSFKAAEKWCNSCSGIGLVVVILVFAWLTLTGQPLAAGGNKEFPVIALQTPGVQYFSPDGNGVQDTAAIGFSVTVRVKSKKGYVPAYGLKITDAAGNTVKAVEEKDERDVRGLAVLFRRYEQFTLEKEVDWDGRDKEGRLLPDGRYSVTVWVRDSSRNLTELKVEDFVIDTLAPAAQIQAPEDIIFSPNGDNYLDTLKVSQTGGTVEAVWSGKFTDQAGKTVREYTWTNAAPADFAWDGRDNTGDLAPDGVYSYSLSAVDQAGNRSPDLSIENIRLNTQATPVHVTLGNPYFSPNNDGRLDTLGIRIEHTRKEGLVSWSWSITDESGKVYHTASGSENPPEQVTVSGLVTGGTRMPEGFYFFTYEAAYQHGNKPKIKETFCLDITPPRVDIAVSEPAFTPNGDNIKDTTTISFTAGEPVSWQARILSAAGEVVREASGPSEQIPFTWDGRDGGNQPVKDGRYTLDMEFTDKAGNRQAAEKLSLALSTRQYPVAVKAPQVFSPNSDGKLDNLVLKLDADNKQAVDKWSLNMEDESGTAYTVFEGQKGVPDEVAWDGQLVNAQGEKVKAREGLYTAILNAEYDNGSTSTSERTQFYLDVTPPKVELAVTSDPFIQTEQGLEGEAFITLAVEDNTDIEGWTLDILNRQKEVVRSFSGEGNPSEQLAWNGEAEGSRKTGAQDIFTLQVNVTDSGGNESTFTQDMPLDIFVVKKSGKLYLMVPNIIFGAYQATLGSAGKTHLSRNQDTLRRVVKICEKYPRYKLLLEGHALNVFLGNKTKAAREERVLYPLTEKRAATVRDALIDLGMDKNRIMTRGFGGKYPLVSVKKKSIYWKNRRVEFILVPANGATGQTNE